MLKQFLPSVLEHSKEAKVYVADNDSSDDSVAFVRENYPEVSIIQNPDNKGYSRGYNQALEKIDAKYYVLLNSDVEVTADWLTSPIALMERDLKVAACQPKILAQRNKSFFEYAGAAGGFIDKDAFMFCRGRIFNHFEEDKGQYDDEREIFWASGACLFIRSEAFHAMEGLDEDFFAHMEEIDLCWRMKNLGYKVMYTGASTVYHVGGGTLSKTNPRKTFLNFRNNLFLITKNYYQGPLGLKLFYRLILDGLAALKFLLDGHAQHSIAIFKAHIAFYKQLSVFMDKRHHIRKDRIHFNPAGQFKKSIVFRHFLGGVKKFSQLKPENFN